MCVHTYTVGKTIILGQDCNFSRADVMSTARSKVGNSKKSPPALGKAGPILILSNGTFEASEGTESTKKKKFVIRQLLEMTSDLLPSVI